VKGYVFTSVQFAVLLALAIAGLIAWRKKAQAA
jgi:nicotinamide mononucleotide transporter